MGKGNTAQLLNDLRQAVISGHIKETEKLSLLSIEERIDPFIAVEEGLSRGIKFVGDSFGRGELYLPDLIMAADAMKVGTAILSEEMKKRGGGKSSLGKFVIGTAKGDIHDIGKTIVATLLTANGFEVNDIGIDISEEKFVESVREYKADIIGISSLLTTTMPAQGATIVALKEANIRDRVKVMVGGAPVTKQWAERIGADAYAVNAADAVVKAKILMGVQS
jgi:corrinoid protein of di/trimethylamine methyltransferase